MFGIFQKKNVLGFSIFMCHVHWEHKIPLLYATQHWSAWAIDSVQNKKPCEPIWSNEARSPFIMWPLPLHPIMSVTHFNTYPRSFLFVLFSIIYIFFFYLYHQDRLTTKTQILCPSINIYFLLVFIKHKKVTLIKKNKSHILTKKSNI